MIKQIELPIAVKVIQQENSKATIKDFSCQDNKELFLWHITQGIKESGT